MAIRVVRDIFNEDFDSLTIQGDDTWNSLSAYVGQVAPDLMPRLHKFHGDGDVFYDHRIDEQLAEGHGPQGLAALGRLARDRPHRGHDGHRRQHRQVRRQGRHARRDDDAQQPRGGRRDRAPAEAARHRRNHRHRLRRHAARGEPRPRVAPPHRVPGPRPHQAPGGRGHLAWAGADDAQARRPGPCRGVLDHVRALQGPRLPGSRRARRRGLRAAAGARPASSRLACEGQGRRAEGARRETHALDDREEARAAVKATLASIAAAAEKAHVHGEEHEHVEPQEGAPESKRRTRPSRQIDPRRPRTVSLSLGAEASCPACAPLRGAAAAGNGP